ncbi:unnamed protein product [Ophioblennius macclurei]
MERGLILLTATVMVFMTSGVRGTDHLSFDNATVGNITRDGCGVTKVCVEQPINCDPAGNSSCLFTSINASTPMPPNGVNVSVELSGESEGYIAMGLTANASQGYTLLFICAQNNGSFFFRTMSRNNINMSLVPAETIVTGIRNSVNGNMIRCTFDIPRINATSTMTRTSHANTFAILIGTGTTNGEMIGELMVNRTSDPVDVTNPSSVVATTTPATNMTMTTSSTGNFLAPHALLLLLSVLALSVSKTV